MFKVSKFTAIIAVLAVVFLLTPTNAASAGLSQ